MLKRSRFLLRSLVNSCISTRYYFCTMEPIKDIKIADYNVDQYGDYPFIQSTFQSGRKWIPLNRVDETLEGQ
jgi:hypothetical protein